MRVFLLYPNNIAKMSKTIDILQKNKNIDEIAVMEGTYTDTVAQNSKIKGYKNLREAIDGADAVLLMPASKAPEGSARLLGACKAENDGYAFLHIMKVMRKMELTEPITEALQKCKKQPIVFVLGCSLAEVVGYVSATTGAATYGILSGSDESIRALRVGDNVNARTLGTENNLWVTKITDGKSNSLLEMAKANIASGKAEISAESKDIFDSYGVVKCETSKCNIDDGAIDNILNALAGEGEYNGLLACVNGTLVQNITASAVVVTECKIDKKGVIAKGGELPLAARCLSLLEVGVQTVTVQAAMDRSFRGIFNAAALDTTVNKQFSLDDIKKICSELLSEEHKCGNLKNIKREDR